ncbi:MAG TPA: type II toxin-antitoxin system VapC family toxin [Gemmataceae bacterium]|jgi:PIN domain nuclease of toxin-antitoxin system|nr:type II toxin-antitoxin system VapC family toxin [Gemmataceae bacterium]
MSDVLADTHSVVWSLYDPGRLSPVAFTALTTASRSGRILISTITLVELVYLAGRRTFPYTGVLPRLYALLTNPAEPLEALPLTLEVAQALGRVPRAEVPDMPDRIIAATAVAHNLSLVSADSDIQGSATLTSLVRVIW